MGYRNNLDECHSVTVAIATENRLDSPNSTTSTYIKKFKSFEFTNNKNNMKNNSHLIRAINIELKKNKNTRNQMCCLYDRYTYIYFFLPKMRSNIMLGIVFLLFPFNLFPCRLFLICDV